MAKLKKQNPLIQSSIDIRRFVSIKRVEDGLLHKNVEAETQQNTKIYRNHSNNVEILCNQLSPSALRIFVYITLKLGNNSDVIRMTHKELLSTLSFKSQTTITKALTELKDSRIIASKARSVYWINPLFIFNGNRKSFYKDNYPSRINFI